MKKDQELRDVIRALRKMHNQNATSEDRDHYLNLANAYRPSTNALDADEAIRELNGWGSADQPREISIELRYALLLYFKGAIKLKVGAKPGRAIKTQLAAYEAKRRGQEDAIALTAAAQRVAEEWSLSYDALDQLLFPRRKKRKTAT